MPLDMTQFHHVFFEETAEHLATMESLLLYLDPLEPDPEQLDDLNRAAHSIKGSSSTFGFQEMAELALEVEALVARVRQGKERLGAEHVAAMHEACDVLRAQLAGYRSGGVVVEQEAVTRAIALLHGCSIDPQGEAKQHDTVRFMPSPASSGKVSTTETRAGTSPRNTAKDFAEAAVELQELARQTATATNDVMALVEAAGSGGLGEVTEAVRGLGEAIEQNAALAEQAVENAESLRESFRALVLTIAGLALSPTNRSAASGRFAKPRPLPKVRRAAGGAENNKAWQDY